MMMVLTAPHALEDALAETISANGTVPWAEMVPCHLNRPPPQGQRRQIAEICRTSEDVVHSLMLEPAVHRELTATSITTKRSRTEAVTEQRGQGDKGKITFQKCRRAN